MQSTTTETELQSFIDAHVATVRPISRETAVAWWENAQTGEDEAADRAAALTARLLKVYADPAKFAYLDGIQPATLQDPLVARQHSVLRRAYLAEQMPDRTIERLVNLDAAVTQEFNNYRAQVRGESLTNNDVQKILRESTDLDLRREAWDASKLLGARVADRVLEMVHLRNEAARAHGFPNHYSKSLQLDELDEERIFDLFDDLIAQSDPLWAEWKSDFDRRQAAKLGIAVDELQPWHYTDLFFQESPPGVLDLDRYFEGKDLVAITRQYFEAIGLPIDTVLKRSDLYERPGKDQHAFCTDIDRDGDVRVLCNIRPNEQWMGTMLHEFGHAVYDLYTDLGLPWLLRGPAHTLSTEAIAEMMGRFSKDRDWLRLYAGVPESEADRLGNEAGEQLRVQLLISTRWIVTMSRFEQALYRDPDQDLNRVWWDMVERYQWVSRPVGRSAPDWASKLHLALTPVYYQNYLLGEMVAAQLLHHLRVSVMAGESAEALFTSRRVGEWLRDRIFAPGQLRAWEPALEYATRERLNPAYFVAQLRA